MGARRQRRWQSARIQRSASSSRRLEERLQTAIDARGSNYARRRCSSTLFSWRFAPRSAVREGRPRRRRRRKKVERAEERTGRGYEGVAIVFALPQDLVSLLFALFFHFLLSLPLSLSLFPSAVILQPCVVFLAARNARLSTFST